MPDTPQENSHKRSPWLGWSRRSVALLLLLISATAALPALAVDKAKVAEAMALKAGKAFESGDYGRAADLYLSAYRTDANSGFLYGAARSQHLAGRVDAATELYQQFLTAANAEPERKKRAQEYLAEIDRSKAVALAADADKAQRDDPKLAASLYLDAYRLAPGRADLLFRAAVAEQQGGDFEAAQRHFEQYLATAPANAAERNQAQARLDSIRRKLNPQAAVEPQPEVKPEPKPEPKPDPKPEPKPQVLDAAPTVPPTTVQAPAVEPARWPGWTLVSVGGVLAVTGLLAYLGASSENKQLQSDLTVTNAAGQISAVTHEEAVSRAESINGRMGLAAGLAIVGVASAGVGSWLLVRTPVRTASIVPQPGGALLVWRF